MNSPLTVVCLCAEWCGACREYRAVFDRLALRFDTGCRFTWVDIEDEAERLDGIDVENFPTLLLVRDGSALFFGPLTPQPQTLQRMIESALGGDLKPGAADPAVAALARQFD